MYQDWDYKVDADFAGTTTGGSCNDITVTAYLRHTGFKPFNFTAGNFKVPFSLEAVSSAKYITFMAMLEHLNKAKTVIDEVNATAGLVNALSKATACASRHRLSGGVDAILVLPA